jgi:hypothetical protein
MTERFSFTYRWWFFRRGKFLVLIVDLTVSKFFGIGLLEVVTFRLGFKHELDTKDTLPRPTVLQMREACHWFIVEHNMKINK